ncbi:hypothetical protein AVEN_266352-1 [Araneus ventricosus]|uniref:Uncharacterized protein n=1 Tax=Araneus ventricosus TaxID=182803 RepID=A0A4Y2CRI0_ARAVE|nr:hypothetical protein AVEN_266352-1 [Araneus ventricosus]
MDITFLNYEIRTRILRSKPSLFIETILRLRGQADHPLFTPTYTAAVVCKASLCLSNDLHANDLLPVANKVSRESDHPIWFSPITFNCFIRLLIYARQVPYFGSLLISYKCTAAFHIDAALLLVKQSHIVGRN